MNPACPACGTATRVIHWRDLEGFELGVTTADGLGTLLEPIVNLLD